MKSFEEIKNEVQSVLLPMQMNATFFNAVDEFYIEPDTRKTGNLLPGSLDGMQIICFTKSNTFEVSECQAGPKQNELHIFKETKSLKIALKCMLKGNKQKPVKIWD